MMTVHNASDGHEVASIFVGLYLNRHYRCFTNLFVRLTQESRNFEYNFTILCLSWFLKLAQSKNFDDRNGASIYIARRMATSCKFNGLTVISESVSTWGRRKWTSTAVMIWLQC